MRRRFQSWLQLHDTAIHHPHGVQAMPDQTVKVSFTTPNAFVFDPQSPTMTAAGKVNFVQNPASATWKFVSINGLPSPEFTWSVIGNGNGITVNDAHTSIGDYGYTITVNDATGNHTSQPQSIRGTLPPMIKNQ
jgi:hypothetical protein